MTALPQPDDGIAAVVTRVLTARHRGHLTPVEAAVRAEHLLFVDACKIRATLNLSSARWPERRRLLRDKVSVREAAHRRMVLA